MSQNLSLDNVFNDIKCQEKQQTQINITNTQTPQKKCKKPNDNLSQMFGNMVCECNFKISFLLFIFYVIFNTDIFNKYVLSLLGGNIYNGGELSERGILIIGILLSISYIILDMLNNKNII